MERIHIFLAMADWNDKITCNGRGSSGDLS